MATRIPGWIKYFPNWNLDQFLEKHKPSEEKDPNVFWVYVENAEQQKTIKPPQDLSYVSTYWNELVKSGSQITEEDIVAIATSTGYTTGKWLVFRKADHIDEVWEPIARATVEGRLGSASKVSSRSSSQTSRGHEHVICVYTNDFTDKEEVFRVEQELRAIGIKDEMTYKADIYTTFGIYANNRWGLRPTLYKSRK